MSDLTERLKAKVTENSKLIGGVADGYILGEITLGAAIEETEPLLRQAITALKAKDARIAELERWKSIARCDHEWETFSAPDLSDTILEVVSICKNCKAATNETWGLHLNYQALKGDSNA